MALTPAETFIIICILALGTMITRFLPFILFKGTRSKGSYISYLGQVLPYSAIALLVVYCLKDVNLTVSPHGIPELIAIISVIILHCWKENTLLSIGIGAAVYMILVQFVFA